MSPVVAARPAGVALEPVVEIVMAAASPRQQLAAEVGRKEGRSPPLDLADVGVLVVAEDVEADGHSGPRITWPSVIASNRRRSPNQVANPP